MNEIWKTINDIFKSIIDFFKGIQDLLFPPQLWHWQTFVLFSIVLWLLSMIISGVDSSKEKEINLIVNLSWLCLTTGVAWRTNQKPFIIGGGFSLAPWITSGLICLLLYENLASNMKYMAIVSWPVIAVCVAGIIFVLNSSATGIEEKVSQLSKSSFVIFILLNFLVSCWLGLFFIIQGMVEKYPTMAVDDLSKSTFVYRLITPSINDYRGAKIMNLMESELNNDLGSQELGLSVPNMKLKLQSIKNEVTKEISVKKEDELWQLQTPIVANQSGYQLELQLIWEGPTANDESYYLSKSCKIEEKVVQRSSGTTPQNKAIPIRVGSVECGGVQKKTLTKSQEEGLKKI